MPHLYVTSLAPGAGKTMLAASVKALAPHPERVRYWKPIALAEGADPDTAFCGSVFGPAGVAGEPVKLDAGALAAGLGQLQGGAAEFAQGSGPLVIEGPPAAGDTAGASVDLAAAADAVVVVVARYRWGMDLAPALGLRALFGRRLRGVVLNTVAPAGDRAAREEAAPALERGGVPVLGIIPEDRLLLGFTAAEYCARLNGRVMNNREAMDRLIENVLVGANSLDPGELYYGRISRKALITRGDRPDLQFSAITPSTRCLILTQDVEPIPYILDRAMAEEVPVAVVPGSTLETVAAIERFAAHPTFHHPEKLARAAELVKAHVDKGALAL